MLLLLALLPSACTSRQPGAIAPNARSLPALPLSSRASPIQARRSVSGDSFTLLGDESAQRSTGAFRNPESHTMWLPALNGGGGWAIYSFAGLAEGDKPSSVGITLTGDLPEQYWVGISDYAHDAWHWQKVKPEGTDYLDLRSLSQPVSASGACHVVLLAYANIPTEIAQLGLYINLPPLAPTHVVVAPGEHSDEYVLSWARSATATGYEIFRDNQDYALVTVGDVDTWTDIVAGAQDRTYWLKATNENGASYFSWPAYGRAGDWQLQLFSRWVQSRISQATVAGNPVIAYVAIDVEDAEEYPYPKFARATTPTPRSVSDWVITSWDDWEDYISRPTRVAQLDGRPAFTIYRRFYRALTPTPSDRDDWEMHLFDAEADIRGPVPLVVHDGIPYIVYLDMDRDALLFARGLSAEPAAGSDWDISPIDWFEVVLADQYSLEFIAGLPTVCYHRRDGIEDAGRLYFAQAETVAPAGSADWQVHPVDEISGSHYGPTEIEFVVLADGRPAVSYIERCQDYYSLMFAGSLVETPADSSDWAIHTVRGGFASTSIYSSMALVDGKPVICYYDGEGIEYAAAKVPNPSSIREWEIETIYEGKFIQSISLEFANGHPQICFWQKDELFLLIPWD